MSVGCDCSVSGDEPDGCAAVLDWSCVDVGCGAGEE